MKGLSKISLYIVSLLGLIGFLWTVFTFTDDVNKDMENTGISFFLIIGIIILILSFVLFFVYKFTDIAKHPKHLKELLFLFGIIIVAMILGFVFSGFDGWISASIVAVIVLLVVSFGFLIFDTVKSILK